VGPLQQPLLVVGFAVGALVYVALLVALVHGARDAVRGILVLYWRNRARRETAATVRRLQTVNAPPQRRAA
jgi:hypothetical protein